LKTPFALTEGRFFADEKIINNLIKIDQIILNTLIEMEL
tara:strand:- start:581 stop:697 length:117 start_codon:yes stop_codon:yes gene_type:complete